MTSALPLPPVNDEEGVSVSDMRYLYEYVVEYGKRCSEVNDEELDYLRFFYETADFGPADGDVRSIINDRYEAGLDGKIVPKGYRLNVEE